MLKRTLFWLISFVLLAPLSLKGDSLNPPKTPTEYVVQKGDYLWKISKTVWGEGKKWLFIYTANQDTIKDPNLVFIGQKLAIPSELTPELIRKAHKLVNDEDTGPGVTPRTLRTSRENTAGTTKAPDPAEKKAPAPPEDSASSGQTVSTTTGTFNPAPVDDNPSRHMSLWIISLLGLIVLGVVVYKLGKSEPPVLQSPRPISQYSQTTTSGFAKATPDSSVSLPQVPERPTEPPKPTSIQEVVPPEVLAGDTFVEQGRYIEAARAFRDILEKDPGNIEVGKKLMRVEDKMRLRAVENTPAPTPPPTTVAPVEPPMSSGIVTSASIPSRHRLRNHPCRRGL